jgi:hypothetical protein
MSDIVPESLSSVDFRLSTDSSSRPVSRVVIGTSSVDGDSPDRRWCRRWIWWILHESSDCE